MPTKTFTLHLAKPGCTTDKDLLTENAFTKLRDPSTRIFPLDQFSNGARLIVFVSGNKEPPWYREVRQAFGLPGGVTTSSSSGLLVFDASDRTFAVSFSHGWMYLNAENFEGDFGLRTAINALDDGKLKRLERSNLGDALRGVALSPFQRDFRSFGLDDALDLVRKISGEAKEEASAQTLTGSRALKFAGECEIDDLPDIATECLTFYASDAYKNTTFRIMDFVTPISDLRLSNILDERMVDSIRNSNEDFELGLPETPEDEGVAYKFSGPNLRRRFPDLLLRNYTSALGAKLADLCVQTLQNHKVVAVYEEASRVDRSWSIRRALVGSIVYEGGRYAINDGEWYRIDETFKASIEASFQELVEPWHRHPRPLTKHYDDRGNGAYQTEESYNEEVARDEGLVLLDRQLFSVPDVPGSRFELCDLLDLQEKRLVHVKKSSRQSSVLSHFFKQGANSAQLIKKSPSIWNQVTRIVEQVKSPEAARRLSTLQSTPEKWGIEFRVADAPRTTGHFNIPFFSKISLQEEARLLRAMDFDVALRFIPLQPEAI